MNNIKPIDLFTVLKKCIGCERQLPIAEYTKKSNPNKCRECVNEYYREYAKNNRRRFLYRDQKKRKTIVGRAKMMITQVRARCKKYNRELNLDRKIIEEKLKSGICEATKLPLNLTDIEMYWNNPFGPSLDGIKSDVGYIDENVQVVCNMYNLGKSKYEELDFVAMCCAVAEIHSSNPKVQQRLSDIRNGK